MRTIADTVRDAPFDGLHLDRYGCYGCYGCHLLPRYSTLSCINFVAASHAHWNEPRQSPDSIPPWWLAIRLLQVDGARIDGVFCASPDVNDGSPIDLAFTADPAAAGGTVIMLDMPPLEYWNHLVIETRHDGDSEQGRK